MTAALRTFRTVKSWSRPVNCRPQADMSAACVAIFRIVQASEITYFLAGDTSYNEELMLAGKLDGVSANEQVTSATLAAIRRFTQSRPTVYLPTHDPGAAERLANRGLAAVREGLLSNAPA